MPDEPRLPSPGPSFLREMEIRPGDRRRVGMSRPQTLADEAPGDGWWVSLLWCESDSALVTFRELGPEAGPPPGSPLLRLGPALGGGLSGLVLEEGDRRQMRLRLGQPPRDETRPWDAPLAVLAAFRFEPARQQAMRETELAQAVLLAFRDAVRGLAH